MQKVDSIIKENPNVSLDDLVASRKINQDQKAQALKKPQLQSQLANLEEQLAAYRKIDSDYQAQLAKEKDTLLTSHVQELDKLREETREDARQEAKKELRNHLLTFSRFLAAAANRRSRGDDTSPEARAFEGVLLLVYGGDKIAVDAAEKVITGSGDIVAGVDGSSTSITCKHHAKQRRLELMEIVERVRELTLQEIPVSSEHTWDDDTPKNIESDPTIANAGLTELEDPTTAELINGTSKISMEEESVAPPTASIDSGASNAAADSQWDPSRPGTQEDPLSESFEMIPRDAGDTKSSTPTISDSATPKQSWSDVPGGNSYAEPLSMTSSTANGAATSASPNDGFHEVKHHHGGRGRSQSGQKGDRGGRGGSRRGSGSFRGGDRGGRGGPRGGYRPRGRGD
jgi:hypothetical protein